ncbi:MAG: DUF5106 domain-containing protein [Bacteroidetes bacterium]|nr:DUF5106 domain-containing protein [Bacteroidota bacterium]
MVKFIWLVFGFFGAIDATAKEFYNASYKITVPDATPGETFKIGYRHGNQTYLKDTLFAGPGGEMLFEPDTIASGVYLLVFTELENKYVEFIINEPNFSISTTKANMLKDMAQKGSKENELFIAYLSTLENVRLEADNLNKKKEAGENVELQLTALDEKVKSVQKDLIAKNPNTLVAKLIKASMEPTLPTVPAGLSETDANNWRFYRYRKVYFNGVDFSESGLVRTPILYNKLEYYLDKLTIQHADSVIKSIDYIMGLANKNEEVMQFVSAHILNKYAKSKVICMDKAYVHMALNYYTLDKAKWLNENQREKILTNANTLKNLLCGIKAPNFTLPNFYGREVSLHSISSPNIVLLFYGEDCGNCTKTINELIELKQSANFEFQVVAVSTSSNKDGWIEYINNHPEMKSWVNVSLQTDYSVRRVYDIKITPFIYLLNSEHEIMYKRLDVSQINSILLNEGR